LDGNDYLFSGIRYFVETREDEAEIYNTKGVLLVERGRYREAIEYYKKAIELRDNQ